jgi:hypothetical protein
MTLPTPTLAACLPDARPCRITYAGSPGGLITACWNNNLAGALAGAGGTADRLRPLNCLHRMLSKVSWQCERQCTALKSPCTTPTTNTVYLRNGATEYESDCTRLSHACHVAHFGQPVASSYPSESPTSSTK